VERACVRPPDYEFQLEVSTRLHRFVSVCTSLNYFTLNENYYTYLQGFVEILAHKIGRGSTGHYLLYIINIASNAERS
jgi:hypothetical protein